MKKKEVQNSKGSILVVILAIIIVILVIAVSVMITTILIKDETKTGESEIENVIGTNTVNTITNELTEETNTSGTSTDTSNITVVEATLENPAQIGEWIKTYEKDENGEYKAVYARVTDIITGIEAQEAVNLYNEGSSIIYIGELEYDELEYALLEYEVYFPEDFYTEYGLTSYDIPIFDNFNVTGLDGKNITVDETTWIGLGDLADVTEYISSPYPSSKEAYTPYSFTCYQVFSKVKDYSDYLLEIYSNDSNGDSYYSYVQGK